MIGERIQELRKMKGLTQQEFADALNVPRSTIAGYEANKREPISATVSLICQKFSVNEEWLRTGEGEMLVSRNRNQILMEYITDCMDKPESFKTRFAESMAKLTDDQWEQVAKIVDTVFEQKK